MAQFAPAVLGGMYWKGGTREAALAGLGAGFAVWVYTLMLPSIAKSGWWQTDFVEAGAFGFALLRPEQLFGLTGLDNLTHSLFWSLLANIGLYLAVSLARTPSATEMSQAMLFVDVFDRGRAAHPVFWRGRAELAALQALSSRFLGAARAQRLFEDHAQRQGLASVAEIVPDAALVQWVETALAGAIGSASARVMVASVVEEEPLDMDDVLRILEEASQLRRYSQALERATAELRAANERLEGLDRLEGRFHVVGHPRASNPADLDPCAGRVDARRCPDADRSTPGVPRHRGG